MIRFLIVDDHSVVRKGLKQILIEEFPDAQIDEVINAEEMVKKAIKEAYDVIISDLSMPGRSGLEALQQIKELNPQQQILILSIHPEEHYALRVLKAGAAGYLKKDMAPEELVAAVHRVLDGKKYITSSIAEKLAQQLNYDNRKMAYENLSDREFEVLKLLITGKSVSDIASLLSLSVTTISTYRSRLMIKLNVKNAMDLLLYAIEHKLI